MYCVLIVALIRLMKAVFACFGESKKLKKLKVKSTVCELYQLVLICFSFLQFKGCVTQTTKQN